MADIAFSLDDARRARSETKREPKHFEFGGKVFDLPVELPFAFSEALAAADWRTAITVLLDGQAEAFFAVKPPVTNDDLVNFAQGIADAYVGTSPGESPASRSRSSRTGQSSRPRSKPSTKKT